MTDTTGIKAEGRLSAELVSMRVPANPDAGTFIGATVAVTGEYTSTLYFDGSTPPKINLDRVIVTIRTDSDPANTFTIRSRVHAEAVRDALTQALDRA